MQNQKVLILDFGGQYNQLIARRVRENNVYCEVHPYDMSLDAIRDGGSMDESAWLLDVRQRIDSEVLTAELADAFCKTLTDSQRSIFRECLIEGKSQTAYAAEHGMTRQSVHDAIALIRKKAKIYFA